MIKPTAIIAIKLLHQALKLLVIAGQLNYTLPAVKYKVSGMGMCAT